MTFSSRLQTSATSVINQARELGLPVARAEALYADTLRPALLKSLAVYAIPFVKRSGVKIEKLEAGHVVCRMPLRGNVNHIGCMYAGALFTLAEFPGGPLMLATYGISRYVPIVTALDMEFVRVAKTDITIELSLAEADISKIEAETIANGKAEFELKGELRDCKGEVVARSRALYQMRPKRR
ncbi:MAG: YiiD C-terminal domain-containing protein [Oceanococcus sp.]